MSEKTNIQWCDSTVNPVMGCAGCELWTASRKTCYAGQLHERRKGHKGFALDFLTPKLFPGRMAEAAGWSALTRTDRPDKPWLDGLPRLIFISDMGDALSERAVVDQNDQPVAGDAVPFEYLKQEIIDAVLSPQGQRHRWLWLTKRPLHFIEFKVWLRHNHGIQLPANLWLGSSVTTAATLKRVGDLAQTGGPETQRFLSVEPLWQAVSLRKHLKDLHWVIVGGESRQGSPAKECKLEWVRQLRDECAEAGVAFLVKQLGSIVTDGGQRLKFRDAHGGDWTEWPTDLRVRQVPAVGDSAKQETAAPVPQRERPYILMSEVKPASIEWLWQDRIPLGEVTVIDGDPGCNKSALTLDIAARVTTGRPMPDGTASVKGGTLLLVAEDSVTKTLSLRLRDAGADMSQVAALTDSLSIPAGLGVIEECVCQIGARLLVIDPLMAFLDGNANKDQSVRQALSPLRRLAERLNLAVILVRHLNKSGGRHSLYRGSGSIGIIGATRAGLLVANDPEDPNMRVLCHTKSNLGPIAPSLVFEPVVGPSGVVRIEWRGTCEYLADDLLRLRSEGDKLGKAKSFLLDVLREAPVEQALIQHKAAVASIAYRTLERAKLALGVLSRRSGFGPGSTMFWELPGREG